MYRTSIFNPEDKLSELRKDKYERDMGEINKLIIGKREDWFDKKYIQVKVYKNIKMFKGLLCCNDILFEEDEYKTYTIFTIYND